MYIPSYKIYFNIRVSLVCAPYQKDFQFSGLSPPFPVPFLNSLTRPYTFFSLSILTQKTVHSSTSYMCGGLHGPIWRLDNTTGLPCCCIHRCCAEPAAWCTIDPFSVTNSLPHMICDARCISFGSVFNCFWDLARFNGDPCEDKQSLLWPSMLMPFISPILAGSTCCWW